MLREPTSSDAYKDKLTKLLFNKENDMKLIISRINYSRLWYQVDPTLFQSLK